jgi:hypothetical protein
LKISNILNKISKKERKTKPNPTLSVVEKETG